MAEFPGATAMALILEPVEDLIADHEGVLALTLVLRQRLDPPASIVLELFRSRINGAIKFAALLLLASLMPE
jgi:hypothetical protein